VSAELQDPAALRGADPGPFPPGGERACPEPVEGSGWGGAPGSTRLPNPPRQGGRGPQPSRAQGGGNRRHAPGARPDLRIERLLWTRGVRNVAGLDEAGRGAWAGPVVAAAVVLPADPDLLRCSLLARPGDRGPAHFAGVRDSKQLSPVQRSAAAQVIRGVALGIGVGIVPAAIVDDLGLTFAGQLAFWRAVRVLAPHPDYLLVDGFPLWSPSYAQAAVLQGDERCLSIAAASVVAKVTRDEIMSALEAEAPGYGFAQNRGYGTPEHGRALRRLGPSPHHRRSYHPVAAAGQPLSA